MGSADVADGNMTDALESDRRAVFRAGGIRSFGLARSPLTLHWAGQTAEAVTQAAQAAQAPVAVCASNPLSHDGTQPSFRFGQAS